MRSPTTDAEVGLIPMFVESLRIILCAEVDVNIERTLRLYASSSNRMLCKNRFWEELIAFFLSLYF
jgi:hypothetical protein